MKTGLISVVVPVYKVENFIEQCLASITNQTYKNIEVFLIDDGSPDRCSEICDNWARMDERFYVIHQKNKGVSAARNRAMNKIRGEYLIFIDSDDWVEPVMLERLVQEMGENIDAVFCGYNKVDEISGDLLTAVVPVDTGIVVRDVGVAEIFGAYSTMLWNKMFRTSILLDNPMFDERLKIGEDELWMIQNLINSRKISLINTPLYNYRSRVSGASKDYSISTARLSEIDSQKKVLDEIKKYDSANLTLLAQKRMYYSCQTIMKYAYYQGDYELFHEIDKNIDTVRKVWYSHHKNLLGKYRRKLVEGMMRVHFPKRIVRVFDK